MSQLTPESVTIKLQEAFGDKIISAAMLYDMLSITVDKNEWYAVMKYLKETEELNFHFLTTLCGLHFPDQPLQFGLMCQLHNMPENFRIRIKTFTADSEPEFTSLTSLWPAANWMERETYDFFGFKFTGHPNLKRILNMDSLQGWPMRKEYPLEDPFRMDKDDKMFGR